MDTVKHHNTHHTGASTLKRKLVLYKSIFFYPIFFGWLLLVSQLPTPTPTLQALTACPQVFSHPISPYVTTDRSVITQNVDKIKLILMMSQMFPNLQLLPVTPPHKCLFPRRVILTHNISSPISPSPCLPPHLPGVLY